MANFENCEVACTSALPLKLSEFGRHAKWDKTQVQQREKFFNVNGTFKIDSMLRISWERVSDKFRSVF